MSQEAEAVLAVLKQYFVKAGKHCGLGMVTVMQRTGYTLQQCEIAMSELRNNKQARQRQGVNGKLYFYVKRK